MAHVMHREPRGVDIELRTNAHDPMKGDYMLIARIVMSIVVASGALVTSGIAFASGSTTCNSLLAPHNASGTTPFSMAFTTTNGHFTGWMGSNGQRPSFTSSGTYLIATDLGQLFSDRSTLDCSGIICVPVQPFDLNQSGNNFQVWIRVSDGILWVWNGNAWEGPFTPINNCNTGMLFYSGTDYGFYGMYQVGLDSLIPPVPPAR
jgi:hypothetical protein